jgi:hypothetical protein
MADFVDKVSCPRRSSVIPSFRGLISGGWFDDGQAIGTQETNGLSPGMSETHLKAEVIGVDLKVAG